jgi:hypothetical protein
MKLLGTICTKNIRTPFLMKQVKNIENKKSTKYNSDNIWLYEDLGIYNSDPEITLLVHLSRM